MPHNEKLDGAYGTMSAIQILLLIWWSLICPYPRHVVLAVWIAMIELSVWFMVWRREKL